MAHGHQARKGATPQAKMKRVVEGSGVRLPPGRRREPDHCPGTSTSSGPRGRGADADQAPTIDSGSQWWEETAGNPSVPAMLTLTRRPERLGRPQAPVKDRAMATLVIVACAGIIVGFVLGAIWMLDIASQAADDE
jgi:hypothetical protein